jgi:hypothetical protein
MYLDAWVSMIVFTLATVCFYILGATVLHRQSLNPEGKDMISTLSQMYVPMLPGPRSFSSSASGPFFSKPFTSPRPATPA